MTTQELIIGHFENTLSQTEESQLSTLLEGSSDARAILEQQRGMQDLMLREAATLAPSAALDESVIGAALGSVTEIAGGGAGFWTGAKLAAGISALVVGGISVFMIASDGGNNADLSTHHAPAPVVRTIPSNDTPALQEPTIVAPAPQEVTEPTSAPQEQATATSSTSARRNERTNLQTVRTPSTNKTDQQQKLNLPSKPQVDINSPTKINPDK